MVQVIEFRPKPDAREAAIDRLCVRIVSHVAAVFYEKRVLDDIPIGKFVGRLRRNLIRDGFGYAPDMIDEIGTDPSYLSRIERMLTKNLIDEGYLPDNFR